MSLLRCGASVPSVQPQWRGWTLSPCVDRHMSVEQSGGGENFIYAIVVRVQPGGTPSFCGAMRAVAQQRNGKLASHMMINGEPHRADEWCFMERGFYHGYGLRAAAESFKPPGHIRWKVFIASRRPLTLRSVVHVQRNCLDS